MDGRRHASRHDVVLQAGMRSQRIHVATRQAPARRTDANNIAGEQAQHLNGAGISRCLQRIFVERSRIFGFEK